MLRRRAIRPNPGATQSTILARTAAVRRPAPYCALARGSLVEGTYSGKMIGNDKDMAPGPVLEQRLGSSVVRDFGLHPRPLTVRVVLRRRGAGA